MKTLPKCSFFDITDPKNFYAAMHRDVKLLYQHPAFTSCTTLILCFLDALAAKGGKNTRGKFEKYVNSKFPDLCSELRASTHGSKGKSGALIIYEQYRNGLAHLRAPKSGFAISRNDELNGRFAGKINCQGSGSFVAINVDRLVKQFLALTRTLGESHS